MTPEMEALVEKVARAIFDAAPFRDKAEWNDQTAQYQRLTRVYARAAITATLEGLMEPTEGMVKAGLTIDPEGLIIGSFRAMLSAAKKEVK